MEITNILLIRSLLNLIFVATSIVIGIKIIQKYKILKNREFLFLGASWILMSSPWWFSFLNLFTIIIFDTQLNDWIELFLSNAFIPFVLIFWIYAYSYSMDLKHKKFLTGLISVICLSYEITFLILLVIKPDIIGYRINSVVLVQAPISLIFAISTVSIIFITGILFSINSIRSVDKETHLRGYFLLVAFSLITICAGFDAFGWQNIFVIVLIRVFLTLSSIFFYFGFFLPIRLSKKFILKEEYQ